MPVRISSALPAMSPTVALIWQRARRTPEIVSAACAQPVLAGFLAELLAELFAELLAALFGELLAAAAPRVDLARGARGLWAASARDRSEEHTSELQSL